MLGSPMYTLMYTDDTSANNSEFCKPAGDSSTSNSS